MTPEQETPQKRSSSSKKSAESQSATQQSEGSEKEAPKPSVQETHENKQSEIAAAREEHNQRAKTKFDQPSGTELADS